MLGRLQRRAAAVHDSYHLEQAAAGVDLREGDVLLLRTGAIDRFGGTPQYTTQYPGLDQSTVIWLHDRKPKIFGVDSPSPDNPGDRIYPAHLFSRASAIGREAWRAVGSSI